MPAWITALLAEITPIENVVEAGVSIVDAIISEFNSGKTAKEIGDDFKAHAHEVVMAQLANTPHEHAAA